MSAKHTIVVFLVAAAGTAGAAGLVGARFVGAGRRVVVGVFVGAERSQDFFAVSLGFIRGCLFVLAFGCKKSYGDGMIYFGWRG